MRRIKFCARPFIFVTFLAFRSLATADENEYREFWDACAHGNLDTVKKCINQDPEFAKKSTHDGESCLHLTAISNSVEIATLVIENGANVNLRVTHPLGLRMTPLAWHTHAGNVSIVKLLLKNGADVNADFDSQYDPEQKVTAMDLARSLMGNKAAATSSTEGNDVDDKFVKTFLALKQFGGFAYDEILAQNGDGINAEL